MTFFLVIDLVLRIFPFFSHIFRMFTVLNVVYDHFLTRKTQFFTLFMLSRTSDNTTSQNIGGDQCMGGPPISNFGGTVPPRSPPLKVGIITTQPQTINRTNILYLLCRHQSFACSVEVIC